MKKLIFVSLALFGIFAFAVAKEPKGGPFQALWDAITNLQEQIANIQLIPGPIGPQGPQGDVGLVGPQGEQGPHGEIGPAGSQLHLFDANGQDLGILINAEANASYFRTYIPTEFVFLNFDQSRNSSSISVTPTGTIYFHLENCIGTPYAGGPGNPHGAILTHGRLFKYTDDSIVYGPVSVSVLEPDGCHNQQFGAGGYPLQEISLPFSLPLAWPLEVKS